MSDEYCALLAQEKHDFVPRILQWGLDTIEPAWARVSAGESGAEAAQWCAKYCNARSELLDYARQVINEWEALPRGLCHREAEAYHAGRRRSTGELLYFDLSTVGMGPRFGDVAGWCRVHPRILSTREEFAQRYLAEYVHWGGVSVSVEEFLDETAVCVRAGVIGWLWQMFSRWDETGESSYGVWTASALEQLVDFMYELLEWP